MAASCAKHCMVVKSSLYLDVFCGHCLVAGIGVWGWVFLVCQYKQHLMLVNFFNFLNEC